MNNTGRPSVIQIPSAAKISNGEDSTNRISEAQISMIRLSR